MLVSHTTWYQSPLTNGKCINSKNWTMLVQAILVASIQWWFYLSQPNEPFPLPPTKPNTTILTQQQTNKQTNHNHKKKEINISAKNSDNASDWYRCGMIIVMIWWIEGSSPNKDGTLFPGFSCKTFRNVEMLMSPVTKYQSTSTNGRGKNIKKMTNVGSHGLGNSGDWYLMIILVLINWRSFFSHI